MRVCVPIDEGRITPRFGGRCIVWFAMAMGIAGFEGSLLAQERVEVARLVWERRGEAYSSGLGSTVLSLGDVDGDGHDDLAVSEPGFIFRPLVQGIVHIISGAEGRVLRTFVGPTDGSRLVDPMVLVGDVDGDGREEFGIGLRDTRFIVVDPDDFRILRTVQMSPDPFGHATGVSSVARLPDLDGDGTGDLAVGASIWVNSLDEFGRGRVEAWSLGRQERLWSRVSSVDRGFFARGIASVGDVTGDGSPDLVVSQPNENNGLPYTLWLLDARTGAIHREAHLAPRRERNGYYGLLAPIGSEGRVIVSDSVALRDGRELGWHGTFSLPEFELLYERWGLCDGLETRRSDWLGSWLSDVGDLDGDFVHDYAVNTLRSPIFAHLSLANIYFRSGRTDELLWVIDGFGLGGLGLFVDPVRLHSSDSNRLRIALGSLATEFDTGTGVGHLYAFDLDPQTPPFVRGDANQDGQVSVADMVAIFRYLVGGTEAPSCLAALDANASGRVIVADAVYLAMFLFSGGCAPEAPYPECARYARIFHEVLTCESHRLCE